MFSRMSAVALLSSLCAWLPCAAQEPVEVAPDSIKAAASKALPLIEKSALTYMSHRQCFSCHHQALPVAALVEASKRGLEVQADSVPKLTRFSAKFLKGNEENYRKGQGQGGAADTAGYALLALEVGGWPPDATTEAVTSYLLQHSKDQDHWKTASNRPPSEASRFTTTYLALRALDAFGTKAQQQDITKRKDKVRAWVVDSKPKDTEDHVFRLRSLKQLNAGEKVISAAMQALLQQQRPDGGWAQVPALDSDAYATGSVLTALHQAGGLQISDPAYQRGLKFLIDSQLKDGSWHVKSRSKPFQLYFESGFPHGKDQFISIAASSWATLALLHGITVKQEPAGRSTSIQEQSQGSGSGQPPKPVLVVPGKYPNFGGDESFYHQIHVAQKPRFQMQGLNVQANVQYVILSRMDIKKAQADGAVEVEQTIESVKFQADELSKPLIEQAAAKLKGAVFKISLNAAREVVKLEGVPENPIVGGVQLMGAQGFQSVSLLDRDGWKEILEATFFQPSMQLQTGSTWSKKMTHTWGPLGNWTGQVHYHAKGKKEQIHQVDYAYQMQFVPPAGKPAGMPFQINGAAFQPLQAKGSLLFDSEKGKVVALEEFFTVRGALNIGLLGINTPVLIEEEQAFQVKIFEQKPAN